MLILNPSRVELGSATLCGVNSLAVERTTLDPLEQWGSGGPWCRLVDSTRRRVEVIIKQEASGPLDPGPALGTQAELRALISTGGDRGRRRLRCTCVVIGVTHQQPIGRPAVRTVSLLGVSPGGTTDPVIIEEAN